MWGLWSVWRGGLCTSYFVWSQQGRLPGGGDSEGTIFSMLCGKAHGHEESNGSSLDLSSFPDSRLTSLSSLFGDDKPAFMFLQCRGWNPQLCTC